MRLRDSLTGDLRELQPGPDGRIGIYVCGPTVYNRIHIGNARPFVVFQLMKNYLEWQEQLVTLVENITDINDKIYVAAAAAGVPSDQLAREMADAYIADTNGLGLQRPDREPRATESVAEIVALIEELIAAGHAYESDGDVYFAVRSFDGYGRLSNQRTDQLRGSDDGDAGSQKRDPLDFALWKANKPDEDSWWKSPWGRGRPGWHIECSAMAERWLGRDFALHGGGRDLIFPHHENEIAQSQSVGRPFARTWAHNGMLRLSGEKMSKSVGNIEPLHLALDRWGAETLIMFFLRAHYAAPIDYTDAVLQQSRAATETLRNKLRDGSFGFDAALRSAVIEALDDDFNTPQALALLFTAPAEAGGTIAEILGVLGLGTLMVDEPPPAEVQALAGQRQAARARGDFAAADEFRSRIEQAGWQVRDTAGGYAVYRRA